MGKAKDAETLSVHASKDNVAIITARAELLSMSKSKFAALIIDRWVAEGAPPVSPADDALLKLKPTTVKRAS
jgi:hypothetical protein